MTFPSTSVLGEKLTPPPPPPSWGREESACSRRVGWGSQGLLLPLRGPELMGQEGAPLGSAWLRAARRGGLHSAPALDSLTRLWYGAGTVVSDALCLLTVRPVTAPRRPEPRGRPTELRPRFRIGAKQPVVSLGRVSFL